MIEDDGFWFWYDMNEIEKQKQKKICKKCAYWKTCKGDIKHCKLNNKKKNKLFF